MEIIFLFILIGSVALFFGFGISYIHERFEDVKKIRILLEEINQKLGKEGFSLLSTLITISIISILILTLSAALVCKKAQKNRDIAIETITETLNP